jgi:NAD(P)-dependent dehydrogenase (short-subunit alcohol dehydrogenase family)
VDGKDSTEGFEIQPGGALHPRAGGWRFVDKIAIAAGGGQGIGSATARRLGQEGAVVAADMVATSAARHRKPRSSAARIRGNSLRRRYATQSLGVAHWRAT